MKYLKSGIVLLSVILWQSATSASPFPPYGKPVSINWWQASCKQGYEVPENKYAKGYCDGVIYSSLNNLEDWCVPDRVTWGEITDLLVEGIKKTEFKMTTSSLSIVEWIDGVLKTKWPCEVIE